MEGVPFAAGLAFVLLPYRLLVFPFFLMVLMVPLLVVHFALLIEVGSRVNGRSLTGCSTWLRVNQSVVLFEPKSG
jgi:hypothetical protein